MLGRVLGKLSALAKVPVSLLDFSHTRLSFRRPIASYTKVQILYLRCGHPSSRALARLQMAAYHHHYPGSYETAVDWENEKVLSVRCEIVRTAALPVKMTRKVCADCDTRFSVEEITIAHKSLIWQLADSVGRWYL